MKYIDTKQKFTGITEYEGKLKYLYEVDVKTRNSFKSTEHLYFLKTLRIFKDSTSLKKKIAYKIHYTSIPSCELNADLNGWFVFKLTIGVNQKVSLNLLVDNIQSNLSKNSMAIIKNRIVRNPEKIDALVYFVELNHFLEENHPKSEVCIINQVFHDN